MLYWKTRIVLFTGAVSCMSCNDKMEQRIPVTPNAPNSVTYVTWKVPTDNKKTQKDGVVYLLNGKSIGEGESGFGRLCRELEVVPIGSVVHVFPDNWVTRILGTSLGSECPLSSNLVSTVPFRVGGEIRREFEDIVTKRQLHMIHHDRGAESTNEGFSLIGPLQDLGYSKRCASLAEGFFPSSRSPSVE